MTEKAITVQEKDSTSAFVTFTINLSSVTTKDVVIDISARSDVAEVGLDFVQPTGQLTIAAGAKSGNLILEVLGDTDIEGDEEIELDLTVASGGTFANEVMTETVGVNVIDNETNFITDEDNPIVIPANRLLSDYASNLYGNYTANDFSLVSVNNSVNGTAILNPDGTIKFTPTANFNGTASFKYTVADGTENKIELAEIIVNSVDDAPIAKKDTITADEDTSVTILPTELLSNDSDVDAKDNLSVVGISNSVNGTATLNQDGKIQFTPAANFNGTASFNYTLSDGTANTTGAVDVVVNSVDDGPIAKKDTITTDEDTSITILPTALLSNDDDDTKDKNNLSIVGISNSVNGTATLNQDGKIQFIPAANFNGTASFSYTLSNGTVNTTGAVDVVVNPVNDAPTIIKPIADFTVTQFAPNTIVELYGRFNDIEDGNFPADSFKILAYTSISLEPYLFQTNKFELVFGFPDNTTGTIPFTVKATDSGNESITDTFSVFRINSTQNGDQLTGVEGNDYLDGKEGDDTLTGVDGNDTLIGSEGNDSLNGDGGNDSLYGSGGNDTLKGGDGNDSLFGDVGSDSMTGGTGNDTYIVDSIGDSISETSTTSTENDSVQSSLTYTLGSNLENLTLTGTSAINGTGNTLNNTLTGNSANNTLDGGIGSDTMTGDAGTDTLIGGAGNDLLDGNAANNALSGGTGNDIYVVDTTTETLIENANEGTDAVSTSVTYTLASNLENLTLTGANKINGTGNDLNNNITGNSANNTLSGEAGNDTMAGGTGNDIYIVDAASDVVTETSTTFAETDLVKSSATYTLDSNLENLTLTGTSGINGTGNDLNNNITGNDANNSLSSGAGNDILIGDAGNDTMIGWTGDDTMTGGVGNDVYNVDSITDRIIESSTASTEIDTVQSNLSYTLGTDLENLTLTGASVINATGNTLNNLLTGNAAINVLTGDDGNDTLNGGDGDDKLYGKIGNDSLNGGLGNDYASGFDGLDTLNGNEGNDSLIGGNGDDVLTGDIGDDSLEGGGNLDVLTGDDGNDTLNGGDGNDKLYGKIGNDLSNGGLGNDYASGLDGLDTLNGNEGNDSLSGGNGDDVLTGDIGDDSMSGGGNLDVLSGDDGNDTLSGGDGDDKLYGTEGNDLFYGGLGNDYASGLDGLDTLYGTEGNDSLSGGNGNDVLSGGTGTDTLIGGTGSDRFVYDTNAAFISSAVGVDLLTDFVSGTDKIVLDKTTFTALSSVVGSGFSLASDFAVVGSDAAAAGANALIVYSSESDNLFYNQNGVTTGLGSGGQFATISGIASLSANDFELQA